MQQRDGFFRAVLRRLHAPIHESRIRALADRVMPHLREGDRVLDMGCGTGRLGQAILAMPSCPPRIQIRGVECHRRGDEQIEVQAYDGVTIPYEDKAYDVVLLADVLHHADEPERLIRECIRVSRRLLIIKDHQVKGFLAKPRLILLDWAANAPFGVPCLYRFWTAEQWRNVFQRHRLTIEREVTSMGLFPYGLNLVFGGGLHYLAVFRVPEATSFSVDNPHGSATVERNVQSMNGTAGYDPLTKA